MALSHALKLPLRSLLLSLALVASGCSSDGSDDALGGGDRIDEPEPEPSDGGAGPGEPGPTEAGAATTDPGESGDGGMSGGGEPDPDPVGGAGPEPEPEPEPGAGGTGGEAPEPTRSEAELRGEALVKENGCVTCHQQNFAGFSVFPNITPDMKSGIGAWTDEQVIKAIRDGVDADGASMCPTMARYPFSDDEVADVVAFLRGLPPVSSKAASACPGHG